MGPNSFQRFKFSGEYYKFVLKERGSDVDVEYYFVKKINMTTDLDDRMNVTFKFNEPVAIGSVITNVRDSANNLILDETAWQTQSLTPVFNPFGEIEFYRARAVIFEGDL